MSPKFELLKRLKAFIGAEGRSPASSQTVYFVAHNLNHYRLMAETCEILGAAGNATMFVCVELAKTAPELIAHWDRIKLPYLGLIRMQQMIRKGDIVVVCNDWGPRYLIDALHRIQRSGAKVIGLVEGTRFQMPGRYELVDELLVWGPSGSEAFEVPTHIVGSPGLEGDWVGSRVRQRGRRCLINYKFTYDERKADQDFGWLEKVTSAAHACGTECTISLHPANDPLPANYSVSDKPILELLQDACVVVTRSSTVVYEALLTGVPVVLFPTSGENLVELAEPMGAFEIARSSEELARMIAKATGDGLSEAASASFLDRHISYLPERSSSQRISDVLLNLVLDQKHQR